MALSASAFTPSLLTAQDVDFAYAAANAPQQQELSAAPQQLELYGQNFCSASFTWFYYGENYFAISLFKDQGEGQTPALVCGLPCTPDECDYFAYTDNIKFPNTEANYYKYYCSTWWMLNADGNAKGAAWEESVIEMGAASSSYLALKEGKYYIQLEELYQTASGWAKQYPSTITFTLVDKKVTDVNVAVADNKQTATLTWTSPVLAKNERLYVSVLSGSTVVYDNYAGTPIATSPLVVNVEEGKSYSASFQVLDKEQAAAGSQVITLFTVGTNNYEPTSATATVFDGDKVNFEWTVAQLADRYELVIYKGDITFSTLTVSGTAKTATMPEDGTYTWTVQPFVMGADSLYYPAGNPVAGNEYTTKAQDVPEGATVQNVWYMEAAPIILETTDPDYRPGYYVWTAVFATGVENGTGRPAPWFTFYSNREAGISGVYSTSLGNMAMGDQITFMDHSGYASGLVTATNAELRLTFEGYNDDAAQQGYRYAYFSGQYTFTGTDGKTYVGKFLNLFCDSQSYASLTGQSSKDHVGLWDEDPDYNPLQDIESVSAKTGESAKVLKDGQLLIIRDGKTYNAFGVRVE